MTRRSRPHVVSALVLLASAIVLAVAAPGLAFAAGPDGQLIWAVHVSLAPTYFEPAETPGLITPFMIYYALHDALVKPMPGNPLAPSLAESWSVSPDGLAYEAHAREGDVPPGHGARLPQRLRAAGGGIGAWLDHGPRVLRPLRRAEAQAQVREDS